MGYVDVFGRTDMIFTLTITLLFIMEIIIQVTCLVPMMLLGYIIFRKRVLKRHRQATDNN